MSRTVRETDARGRVVKLTEKGRGLVDEVLVAHMANESHLLAELSDRERAQLARLLSKLLVGLEGEG